MSQMRPHGMAQAYQSSQEARKLHALDLNEGLELPLQTEEDLERQNRRFRRLEYNASFRYEASMEELKTDPSRGVDKQLIVLRRFRTPFR